MFNFCPNYILIYQNKHSVFIGMVHFRQVGRKNKKFTTKTLTKTSPNKIGIFNSNKCGTFYNNQKSIETKLQGSKGNYSRYIKNQYLFFWGSICPLRPPRDPSYLIVQEFQSLHLFYLFCITKIINSPLEKGVRGL